MKTFRNPTPGIRAALSSAACILALSCAAWTNAAEPPPVPESPQPVVRAYMKAMKTGDIDAALKLTAEVEGLSRANIRSGLEKYSRTLREQEVETVYHESRATQGCALVIVEQRRPRIRTEPAILPVMLVLQNKEWRTLPKLNPELRKTALSRDQMEEIRVLGKWFVEQVGGIEARSREELGKPMEPSRGNLAGVWQHSDDGIMNLLKLGPEGAFEQVRVKSGKLAGQRRGSWRLKEKKLFLEGEPGDFGADGWNERRIVAVTRNILGTAPAAGPREIWSRVPEETYRKLVAELNGTAR